MAKQEYRQLYRSETNRNLGGVCGGLGEYFGIDPVIFRVAFVVAVLVGLSGILAYLILWLVIPTESAVIKTQEKLKERENK